MAPPVPSDFTVVTRGVTPGKRKYSSSVAGAASQPGHCVASWLDGQEWMTPLEPLPSKSRHQAETKGPTKAALTVRPCDLAPSLSFCVCPASS